jgi:hypothetical protein
LTSSGHAYDPGSGSDYGAIFPTSYGISTLGVSQDGTRFVLQEKGISPSRFSVFSLAFSPNNGGTLSAVCVASGSGGSNGTDAVLNRDGSRVYTACGSPYDFGVFDGATGSNLMTLPGDAYPNNVEVAWDGRLIAGANVSYGPSDIWIYSESGALLSRLKASGYACNILPGQLRVSADGLRLAVLTSDPSLQFITIP